MDIRKQNLMPVINLPNAVSFSLHAHINTDVNLCNKTCQQINNTIKLQYVDND